MIRKIEDLIYYKVDAFKCEKCIEIYKPDKPPCLTQNKCCKTKREPVVLSDFEEFLIWEAFLISTNDFQAGIKFLEKEKIDTAENIEILNFLRTFYFNLQIEILKWQKQN